MDFMLLHICLNTAVRDTVDLSICINSDNQQDRLGTATKSIFDLTPRAALKYCHIPVRDIEDSLAASTIDIVEPLRGDIMNISSFSDRMQLVHKIRIRLQTLLWILLISSSRRLSCDALFVR